MPLFIEEQVFENPASTEVTEQSSENAPKHLKETQGEQQPFQIGQLPENLIEISVIQVNLNGDSAGEEPRVLDVNTPLNSSTLAQKTSENEATNTDSGKKDAEQIEKMNFSCGESTNNNLQHEVNSKPVPEDFKLPPPFQVTSLNTEFLIEDDAQNSKNIDKICGSTFKVHKKASADRQSAEHNESSTKNQQTTEDTKKNSPQIVFLFTGQGAQYQSMGQGLLSTATENVFRASMDQSNTFLKSLGCSWDLFTELEGPGVDAAHIAIPTSVALQIALVELLKSRELSADVVIGHSTGEIAAAFAAGVLSHEHAIKLAYHLGDVLLRGDRLDGRGKMLVAGLGQKDIQQYLKNVEGIVGIACTNSASSTTISGESNAVDKVRESLEKAEVFCRELKVNCAYHSTELEELREEFEKIVEGVEARSPKDTQFYSSVTGGAKTEFNIRYWMDNMTSKVIYNEALESLLSGKDSSSFLFVEIGPQPHLQRSTREVLDHSGFAEQSASYYSTLLRGVDAASCIVQLKHNLEHHDIYMETSGLERQLTNVSGQNGDVNGVLTNGATHTLKLDSLANKKSMLPLLESDLKILQIFENLSQKLSSLGATPSFEIPLERTIADCGLDSHLAMELKSWIQRQYNASVSIQEILDTSSLLVLAISILRFSGKSLERKVNAITTVQEVSLDISDEAQFEKKDESEVKVGIDSPSRTLPKLPLPDLDDTLEHYYASVEAFGDADQLSHTRKVIADFQSSEQGRKLQERLMERVNDPKLDCWLADLYNSSNFLDRNGPLVPFSSFFYTHKLSPVKHTQSERAAVITLAVMQYKEDLQHGIIEPAELNGQPTCMFLFNYLFNTTRVPRIGSDIMEKHPKNDYVVVIRRGRAFKVSLFDGGVKISYEKMKAILDWIVKVADGEMSMLGILTSDDRNSWAKNRQVLKSLNAEDASIDKIESASFVLCLDDASPEGASERARHFHFGDGSNRWNDKSIQFIVCENGISGFVGDHSMLDAGTVLGLNKFVTKVIFDHQPDETKTYLDTDLSGVVEEILITTSPEIDAEVARVVEEFGRNTANITHAFTTYTTCGGALPRSYKCPPKSFFQIVVVLASKHHFGYNSAFWETVSLGNFHKGRVEINQVVRPVVVRFCEVVDNSSVSMATKRELLFEAVKVHTSSVMRAVRGRGVDRHLTSLRQMVRPGEDVPLFFKDPIYNGTRPRKIMSHCHETGMAEKGFVLRDLEAVWVHYEVEDESVHFSVTGVGEVPKLFCDLLEKAAGTLREILVSV